MAKATKQDNSVSDKAAATRAEIGNRPRQSQVRLVQYFRTISEAAPDRIEELFGDQAEVLAANADKVASPIQTAIDKVAADQVAIAVRALTNDDALNGYAGFRFDQEAFDKKTAPKKTRVVKDKVAKASELVSAMSDEEAAALAALLAARNA